MDERGVAKAACSRVIIDENKIARDGKSKCLINKYMEKLLRFDYDESHSQDIK
jgi:hypothetical protein